jgi:hypothetical protein
MSEKDDFLLKEYSTAIQLIFHIDELRYKLTTLFLSIASIGAAGITILVRQNALQLTKSKIILGVFLFMAGIIGGLIVLILGRLRRHQIEHYRICDKIRNYFFKCDYTLWNIVEKSETTRPKPITGSAPYYWLLIIIMVGSLMLGLSACFFILAYFQKYNIDIVWYQNVTTFGIVFYISAILQRDLYFKKAASKQEPAYNDMNPPFIRPDTFIINSIP